MDDALKGLFGGGADDNVKAQANDFVQRYETGNPAEGYTDDEAKAAFKAALSNGSPEQVQAAVKQAAAQLTPEQRSDFAKMLQERSTAAGGERPTIQQSGQAGAAAADSGGDGLDDLLGSLMGGGSGGLGGLLGGLMGGATATTGAVSQSGQPAQDNDGGLDDLLGGLLGSPAGKAMIAGVGAMVMKSVLGGK